MELFKYELSYNIDLPKVLENDLDNKFCFLDIETTGLSSKYHKVILIGMLCVENDNVHIVQFFAHHPDKEKTLLDQFSKYLSRFHHVFTFNGLTFDIPFLRKRLELHNIESNIDDIENFDLLRTVRKHKEILNLENCKLKTVEKSLGLYREDTISGKESVELYNKYAFSNDKDFNIRDTILKHNYDDIYYLPKLLSIYDIIDKKNTLKVSFNYKNLDCFISIDKDSIVLKNNKLSIVCKSSAVNLPYQIYHGEYYVLDWDTDNRILRFEINYKDGAISSGEKCSYIDLNETDIGIFISNKLSYSIPDKILLLKVDTNIIYDNLKLLITNVLNNIR